MFDDDLGITRTGMDPDDQRDDMLCEADDRRRSASNPGQEQRWEGWT